MDKILNIPEEIFEVIKDEDYQLDDIGLSDSSVYLFSKCVLKIQNNSNEALNEVKMIKKLSNDIPLPKLYMHKIENNKSYTLMSRVEGKMLCDSFYLENEDLLLNLASEVITSLWSVDVSDLKSDVSLLQDRLKQARYNVENGLVDINNVEPTTFKNGSFKDPYDLLNWLENNMPPLDIVLSHGDLCLPNIIIKDNKVSGLIDIGKMGPADRYQDIAILLRSIDHNAKGKYNGYKHKYFDFNMELFINRLGIEFDWEKYRYYYLLDELF